MTQNPRIIYRQRPADNLTSVKVTDVNNQLANHLGGRSLFYVQWALAEAGYFSLPVDGVWSVSVMSGLDACRGNLYDDGHGTYAPLYGPSVSLLFLTTFFQDYLTNYPPVVA